MSEYKITTDNHGKIVSIEMDGIAVTDYMVTHWLSESIYNHYKQTRYGDDRCDDLVKEAFQDFEWVHGQPYKKNKRHPIIHGVYFTAFENLDGLIKIGHSTNVWKRIKNLRYSRQTPHLYKPDPLGLPYLHFCVVVPSGKDIQAYEFAFHHYFSDHQVGLEFYNINPVLDTLHSLLNGAIAK